MAIVATDYEEDNLEKFTQDILIKEKFNIRVQSITYLAKDILAFEFVDPDGAKLAPFTAGSHIDVHLPNGLIRQYSLCNDPEETHRYVVAVLNEPAGRGGSAAMHNEVRPGTELTISQPHNRFSLSSNAQRYILLAGGIGVTPIMAMISELSKHGRSFHLYYCTRSLSCTAFFPEIRKLVKEGKATLIHDHGNPSNGLALDEVLVDYHLGDDLYYCGPGGFIDAIEKAAMHWPDKAKHCERFAVTPADSKPGDAEGLIGFDIKLESTGAIFHVDPGESIVTVLRNQGVHVDTSCEKGYCGTCMTRYLEGRPAHHDVVLDEEDREEYLMICCARAQSEGECLVLDI